MPDGEQPVVDSNVVVIENTTNLKVYYRVKIADGWVIDKGLICIGMTSTQGLSLGSASFVVLPSNNEFSSSEYQEIDSAMRYSAATKYRVDMSQGWQSPYYVKVTDQVDGRETAIFYGYIDSVEADLTKEIVSVSALTYANLLDSVDLYGGWFNDTDSNNVFYPEVVPIFNPNGVGNRYLTSIDVGGYQVFPIDNELLLETAEDSNLWSVRQVIDQIWARGLGSLGVDTPYNSWRFIGKLYDRTKSLDGSEDALGKLELGYELNNYEFQGKTFWGALVDLVESVQGLTITESIDTSTDPKNGKSYLSIVDLKG